jgi:hypothetical protein
MKMKFASLLVAAVEFSAVVYAGTVRVTRVDFSEVGICAVFLFFSTMALFSEVPHVRCRIILKDDSAVRISGLPAGMLVLGKSGAVYLYDLNGHQLSKLRSDATFCEYSAENRSIIVLSKSGLLERLTTAQQSGRPICLQRTM